MKKIFFTAILISALSFTTFAQKEGFLLTNKISFRFDELVRFDEYERLTPKDERARLDSLFITVAKDKNLKSLIVIRFDKNEPKKIRIKRLREIAKHFDFRKTDKTKFTLAILDAEKERTELWVEPQDVNLENLLLGETTNYKIIKAQEFKQKIDQLFPKK